MPLEAQLKRYDQLCQQLADITFDFIVAAYRSNQPLHINTWRANQILTLSTASELLALCEAQGIAFSAFKAKLCSANKTKTKGLSATQAATVIPLCKQFNADLEVFINDVAEGYGTNHRVCLSLRRIRQLMLKTQSDLEKLV